MLLARNVLQQGEYDCFVAALATATGFDYHDIAPDFEWCIRHRRTPGPDTIAGWLGDNGFRAEFRPRARTPFAAAHIVKVMWGCPHFVAMDRKGVVLDPYPAWSNIDGWRDYKGDHDSLSHPDFVEVFWSIGFWPRRA